MLIKNHTLNHLLLIIMYFVVFVGTVQVFRFSQPMIHPVFHKSEIRNDNLQKFQFDIPMQMNIYFFNLHFCFGWRLFWLFYFVAHSLWLLIRSLWICSALDTFDFGYVRLRIRSASDTFSFGYVQLRIFVRWKFAKFRIQWPLSIFWKWMTTPSTVHFAN